MFEAYVSRDIGLFVVLVARNKAVNLSLIRNLHKAKAANIHDILRMPIHHSILEVETFDISHRGRFHLLGESKVTTKLANLCQVVFDKQNFLVCSQERNI
jgi:hypothetical protein